MSYLQTAICGISSLVRRSMMLLMLTAETSPAVRPQPHH